MAVWKPTNQEIGQPKAYAFIHGQSPCLHTEVLAFTETFRTGVPARRRSLLRRRIKRTKREL